MSLLGFLFVVKILQELVLQRRGGEGSNPDLCLTWLILCLQWLFTMRFLVRLYIAPSSSTNSWLLVFLLSLSLSCPLAINLLS